MFLEIKEACKHENLDQKTDPLLLHLSIQEINTYLKF